MRGQSLAGKLRAGAADRELRMNCRVPTKTVRTRQSCFCYDEMPETYKGGL